MSSASAPIAAGRCLREVRHRAGVLPRTRRLAGHLLEQRLLEIRQIEQPFAGHMAEEPQRRGAQQRAEQARRSRPPPTQATTRDSRDSAQIGAEFEVPFER